MSAAKPTATHREVHPGLAALAYQWDGVLVKAIRGEWSPGRPTLQRLGQPAEPGRISSECEILGSDAGSAKWCTKSRVRHQLERVRIGQAGSQSCPSHLQRSSTNGRGLQVAPQVSRGLSLRQDHHQRPLSTEGSALIQTNPEPTEGFVAQSAAGVESGSGHPHNRLSLRARITSSSSRIFSAMQFSSIHCTRDLAHVSPAPSATGSPSPAFGAGFWPAGCVSPAGRFSSKSCGLSMAATVLFFDQKNESCRLIRNARG